MNALHCSADVLHNLMRLLSTRGLKTRQLPRFDLPADALFNSRARIPVSSVLELVRWAEQTLGQPELSLDFGLSLALAEQDSEFRLAAWCNEGVEKPAALMPFDTVLRASDERHSTLQLHWDPVSGIPGSLRNIATNIAIAWLHQRWLPVIAGRHQDIQAVLSSEQAVESLEAWFPNRFERGEVTSLTFPRSWLDAQNDGRRTPEIDATGTPQSQLITHKAANMFRASLNDAPPLEELAHKLGLSERTCKRRLQECGTHYQKLLGELRLIQASYWLQQHQHKVTDVAVLLGYSSVANFSKAFKKWCGYSPSQVRHGVPAIRHSTGPARLAAPASL